MVVREIRSSVRDGQEENGEESGLRESANARLVSSGGPENFEDYQTAGQNRDQVGRPIKQGISVVRELVNEEPDDFSGQNAGEVSEKERVSFEEAVRCATPQEEAFQNNGAAPDESCGHEWITRRNRITKVEGGSVSIPLLMVRFTWLLSGHSK